MNAFSSFWCMFDDGKEEKEIEPVGSEEAYSFPECDYEKNPTNLYKQIEIRNWTAVNHFLLTGYWTGSFFADSIPPSQQVCTWVTKYDPNAQRKKVLWTHLPIHAALSYGAPEGVVQLLIKIAPPTLRCADDQRMLPLHLAFRRGASDATIASIIEAFPEACAVRDFRGRTPPECAEEGPNAKRGHIINTVLKYNKKAWEKKASKEKDEELHTMKRTLMQRNERIENLQTAFDLVRVREDQTREYFKLVMKELGRMKEWHDEKAPEDLVNNGGTLSAIFVKELTDRFDALFSTAETLNHQHKKAKADSDRTLKALKAVWDLNGWDDLKVRSFETTNNNSASYEEDTGKTDTYDEDTKKTEAKDNQSEVSSVTSLNTSSTNGKKEAEKMADSENEVKPTNSLLGYEDKKGEQVEEEQRKELEEEKPEEKTEEPEQAEEEEPEGPVEEPAIADVEVSVQGTPKTVPGVVSLEPEKKSSSSSDDEDDDTDIKNVISEMTSLDMSEGQGSGVSNKKNMFRMGLAKITRSSSKRSISKNSLTGKSTKSTKSAPLPKGHKKKPIQLPTSLLKKGPGSLKVSPAS